MDRDRGYSTHYEITEIWKDIPIDGFNHYKVSNLGRVMNKNGQILHDYDNNRGYRQLMIYNSKTRKGKSFQVHRLVALAFVYNSDPDLYVEINHIDENRTNNRADNLEWCTHVYNSNYGSRKDRCSIGNMNHPSKSKQVRCVENGIIYPSAHEAARQLNLDYSKICAVCRGDASHTHGMHFEYE